MLKAVEQENVELTNHLEPTRTALEPLSVLTLMTVTSCRDQSLSSLTLTLSPEVEEATGESRRKRAAAVPNNEVSEHII